ncbi:MAG: hypothetical protein ABEJ87_01400 [Candidatus Nanohalobium sp.]
MSLVGEDYYPLGESSIFSESETGSSEDVTVKALTATAALTASGIIGRVALQHLPSIETVLPVAIAVGFYAGRKQGIASGLTGFYITNFLIWGGQGPWTFFQMAGAGLAALSASYMSNISSGKKMYFSSLVVGTAAFELVINFGSLFFSPVALFSIPSYLMAAVPFALTHLVSTVGFGVTLYGFDRTLRSVYGRN